MHCEEEDDDEDGGIVTLFLFSFLMNEIMVSTGVSSLKGAVRRWVKIDLDNSSSLKNKSSLVDDEYVLLGKTGVET